MNSDFAAVVGQLLSTVPWPRLLRADAVELGAESVPPLLTILIRGEEEPARRQAADELYCAVANQAVAGDVTPHVTEILVRVLREGLAVDRNQVYFLLCAAQQCQAWVVGDDRAGRSLIVAIRRHVESGLTIYLSDLADEHLCSADSWLFALLFELAAHYPQVVDGLAAAVADAGPTVPAPLAEAYRDALEHQEEHRRDPEDCFCGQQFWDLMDEPDRDGRSVPAVAREACGSL